MSQARFVKSKKPKSDLLITKLGVFYNTKFQRRLQEGLFILTLAISVFLLLALLTYHTNDPSWSCTGSSGKIANAGGIFGAWIADILICAFGYMAYIFPLLLVYAAWLGWRQPLGDISAKSLFLWRTLGFFLVLSTGSTLCNLHFASSELPFGAGGVLGNIFHAGMFEIFGAVSSNLILVTFLLIGATLFSGLSWLRLLLLLFAGLLIALRVIWKLSLNALKKIFYKEPGETDESIATQLLAQSESLEETTTSFLPKLKLPIKDDKALAMAASSAVDTTTVTLPPSFNSFNVPPAHMPEISKVPENYALPPLFRHPSIPDNIHSNQTTVPKTSDLPSCSPEKATTTKAKSGNSKTSAKPSADSTSLQTKMNMAETASTLPALSLLDEVEQANMSSEYSDEQLTALSNMVEFKLKDFGIDSQVVAVHPGPVVTRFELQLAAGTKVSRITSLVKDLARSLSVTSVRIVEVIPGKSAIGLELPNKRREIVRLREILATPAYVNTKAALALTLGKDISGQPIVVDLVRMPHLLVAGTTGAGKSVCLNAILLSILYKYTPREVRLILIDPKMLELSVYERIPHLLVPVVTDMKEAVNALRWCVYEMERRYRLLMALGVRNVAGYNHKIKEARQKGKPLLDPLWEREHAPSNDARASASESVPKSIKEQSAPELQELPYVTVIADEYADMIMVVGKKVEELIARLAQKARAAGIHLILATQRPSVDVITGLIKANIPARIAFQVSSKIDSRTILDQSGAEQLLGHGDMLYLSPGSGIPMRVHGAFVSDEEVHRVADDWKEREKVEYVDGVLDGFASVNGNGSSDFGGDSDFGGEDAESDALYDHAVQFVARMQRVSVSSIQRRFKIGYNRAARIVEAMEKAGVVSPMENNGNRTVLIPAPPEG